jgi:hypothetical protein
VTSSAVELAVVDAGLHDLDWPARFAETLARLVIARATGARITFSETDVDRWAWDDQAITLSVTATERLVAVLPRDAELADSARAMKRMHDELRWGNPIGLGLQGRGFLISLAGEPLYGGLFLEAVSERAVDVPVLRTSLANGRVTLRILPVHLPFLIRDPGSRDATVSVDDIAPEARGDWPIVGSLWRRAYGSEAARLGPVIRNSRLRAALAASGKLA